MKKVLVLFAVLMAFSSTALAQITRSGEDVQARSADAVQSVFVHPMVMETVPVLVQGADNTGKVTFTYRLRKRDYRKNFGGSLENLRAYTVYLASKEYGVDAFGGSLFFFTVENNECTMVMTGYPVKYTKMREASDSDLDWMSLVAPMPQSFNNVQTRRSLFKK